jgi:hypothetical protein
MECRICGKIFLPELTFVTLFHLIPNCPECVRRFRPGFFEESIPYQGGMMDYAYVFDEFNEDPQREDWLFRHMDKCFNLAIFKQSQYGFVLILGETEFASAPEWLPFLQGFEKVLVVSLFRHDFAIYEDCL